MCVCVIDSTIVLNWHNYLKKVTKNISKKMKRHRDGSFQQQYVDKASRGGLGTRLGS